MRIWKREKVRENEKKKKTYIKHLMLIIEYISIKNETVNDMSENGKR